MPNALALYRPGKPCLTPRVAWALSQSERRLFPNGRDPISIPDPNWQLPAVDASVLTEACTAIAERARYLTPIDPERLSARIAAMLANCPYVEDVEPAALDMAVDMWRRALARFPEWAVAEATDD